MQYEHYCPPPPTFYLLLTRHTQLQSSSLISYLASLGPAGLFMTLQNTVLLSAFYFAIYITSFFQFVHSSLCLFCQCRTPLDPAVQHVSVDASCCCPKSVYMKLWILSRHQTNIPKIHFCYIRCFLSPKLFWPIFCGSVSQFYLISGY
jgi:hypothetical protein